MLIVDCATSSTLQELKTNKSSGVYSYDETDNFQSVTCNRYIVWRTCDDILELSEHSLNKNLIDSVLKIQFKNTLILPSGVSIHETADRIYVLVTTLVSAHRFAFTHPNKLLTNPSGISAAYSIFHHVPVDNSAGNSCQLPSAGSGGVGTTSLGSSSSSPAFLASCSWINKHLEAYFVVSKNSGSLQVIKLPPPFSPSSSSTLSGGDIAEQLPKVHTIDLKQNSFIGSAMSLITGFVPAFKSTSSGEEAAISLLSYSTADDDLIYALCRDGHIRVLSLRRQEVLIVHSLLGNQQLLQAQMHGGGGGGGGGGSGSSSARDVGNNNSGSAFQSGHSRRRAVSMKLWWHDDDDTDTGSPLPNLVVYLSGGRHRSFYFFETIIRQTNSSFSSSSSSNHHHHHQSLSSSYSATHTVAHHQTAPHLKFLLEVVAGDEQELVDYLVAGNQLWALWQANDTFSLQYYSIEESYASQGAVAGNSGVNGGSVHPPLEWMPVLANVNAPPEMDARCSSDNSREYFLREIFWRGSFSLTAIAKAIAVSNRVSIEEFGEQEDGKAGGGGSILSPSNLKIDTLMRDAINLVDGLIRSQMDHLQSSNSGANGGDGIANVEFTVEQYTELEYKAWDDLYAFVLGYHLEESRPLSIFADVKTGAKGIVRQGRVEFIPALEPFDELIDYYFLLCRDPSPNQSLDLINDPALDYRLNTLMAKLERRMRSPVSAGLLQQSIRELLAAMSVISRSLSEDDLLNFAALMSRISSFSSKTQQTLSDIAKLIAEDHLLPEMSGLAEGGGLGSSGGQDSSSIDDFFSRCPMVAEAIAVLLAHLKFDFVAPDSAAAFPFNQSPHHHFLLAMNNSCEGCEEDSSEDSNDSGGGGVGVASSTAGGSLLGTGNGGPHWKMAEALQSNINPLFISLLASRTGLNFVVGTVARVVAGRYRFCRDLFLFQYFLNKFRLNLRADCMTKITAIEADTIPNTTQLLFSLDYLNWAASTPMVNPGLWWSSPTSENQSSTSSNTATTTTIVSAASGAHSPPKSSLTTVKHSMVSGGGSSIGGGSSAAASLSALENTELLSVLELREYIDLNRLGILSHSTTFYDAYPQCTVLHFFIAFSGGILTRRLLSYKLATQYGGDLGAILAGGGGGDDSESGAGSGGSDIWRLIVTNYLSSVGQLLWPLAEGQLKLAEFLLGVGQYDLLERLNQRLHWCMEQSFSRTFLKGVVSLVTGEGQKAIRHLEQALHGVDHEAFLAKIFSKRAARRAPEIRSFEPQSRGSETGGDDLLAKGAHSDCDGDEEEEEDVQPNARTVYRYYNKLIQLFKRYSSPDYVIQLVEVALITLSPETDPEVEEHHSSLQSTLFACYLQLGAVEQAYNAMMGNGDGEQRRICLRQFILALCEAGDTASLVSFNYQGLEEEFVGILESKARTSGAAVAAASRFYSGGGSSKFYHPHHHQDAFSTASRPSMATTNTHSSSFTTGADSSCYPSPASASLSSSPPHSQPINYHHILYSYFIQVHQYRRAAQAMYDYYRQLRLEGAANSSGSFGANNGTGSTADQQLELLQKQAEALLIARNCLKLVEPSASYVNKNGGGKRAETAGNQSASASLKRKYSIDQTAETSSSSCSPPPDPTIDEEALWREYELVSARHRLLQRNAKEYAIAASLLSAEEAVTFCVDACLYEAALRLSTLFRLPLEPVFGGMASKYVQLLHGAYNHRRIDDDMVLALFEGAEMGGGGGAGGYGSASAYGSNAVDPLASPSLLQQPPTTAATTTINSVNIDLLDIFYENGSNVAKSSFISYSTLSVCDRMWHLVMHYLERYETAPASSSRLMRKVAEVLLSNGVMLPASLSKVYQKVNCPELIRLLMSYNFLAEATAVSLDYMNAFMGHGLEYFDIKHSLYPNCPPLCIPLHIFNCLLKILREESEESKLEQWQNRLATEDTAESIHGGGLGGGASSVDDYGLAEERIDYEELYKKLSQRKQKLQEAITNYSS